MKSKRRAFKVFIFLLSIGILSTSLYFSSNRILSELGEKSYGSLISNASYQAIEEVIKSGYDYKDLISVEKNSSGDVIMIITDSVAVNGLSADIASKTYDIIDKKTNEGVGVPLGAFSGIRLLSGFGERINMKLLSVTSVKCEITSEFQSAGINQTRHAMYVNIVSEISIITKISTKVTHEKISVLVYDNLIVGKVPAALITSSAKV